MYTYRIWPFLSFKSLTFENKTLTEVSPFQRLWVWIISTAGDLKAHLLNELSNAVQSQHNTHMTDRFQNKTNKRSRELRDLSNLKVLFLLGEMSLIALVTK